MGEGSIHEVIADASDADGDIASLVQRLWEARGYETTLRFSGPDVHVDAVGETEEGATRRVRTWVGADGATERGLRVFVDACDREEAEPHVVAVRDGLDPGVVPPGVATFDAGGLAVELREAGVDPDSQAANEDDADEETTDWFGDPVAGDGANGPGEGGDGDDENDDEEISRREAVVTVGKYVSGGFVVYLGVERLSDYVRSSPRVRAAVRRRAADLRARLPTVDVPFDPGGTPPSSRVEEAVPGRESASDGDRPANATRVPYHELATDPTAFRGVAVRYEGTVDGVREREGTWEMRLLVTAASADEWTGAVVCRWETGALFSDSMSVRLLENEAVTVWGVVRGESAETRYDRAVPLVELLDVARADE